MGSRCWPLSPADLALLWDECPRCFYLEVVRGFPRPRRRVTPTLAHIAAQMRAGCHGRRTEALAPEMPAGVFEMRDRRVESAPVDVHLPDAVHRCLIRGDIDALVRLDAGGYALIDLAAAGRRPDEVPLYARQLHAAAYALEHPAAGTSALGPVTCLGLLVFEPEKFAREAGGLGVLTGGLSWIEVPRDDRVLFGFLAEVLAVLERPEPPGGAPLCDWCVYRDASRRTGL